jgi:hypothetical protein
MNAHHVYVVNLVEEEDGLYLFAYADDARRFAEAQRTPAVQTEEPVFSREQAQPLIEVARQGRSIALVREDRRGE